MEEGGDILSPGITEYLKEEKEEEKSGLPLSRKRRRGRLFFVLRRVTFATSAHTKRSPEGREEEKRKLQRECVSTGGGTFSLRKEALSLWGGGKRKEKNWPYDIEKKEEKRQQLLL